MKLVTGTEKKVFDFISKIGNNKTVLISHIDLDGITSARIVNEVVKALELKFVEYEELNLDLVKELNKKEVKRVIFTDLYIKDKEFIKSLEEFAEILILDHHLSPDWNSAKTVSIRGEEGYSAGYLCYYLFSKIKNLEYLDWLVACSCVSDYCHVKPKEWLERVFKKYGDELEKVGEYVRKNGKFWDLQSNISMALIYFKDKNMIKAYNSIGRTFGDIGNLDEYSREVKKDIDYIIKEFKKKRENIDQGYFFEINSSFSINSIVSSILSGTENNKTFVITKPEEDLYRISVRRQDGKVNCNKFMQELILGLKNAGGGGHAFAAGGNFMKKDLPEIRKRLGLK